MFNEEFLILGKDVLKWTYKDGGFTYHLISTFSEWLLVFSFCAYVSTIFWDFRKIKIVPPTVKVSTRDIEKNCFPRIVFSNYYYTFLVVV